MIARLNCLILLLVYLLLLNPSICLRICFCLSFYSFWHWFPPEMFSKGWLPPLPTHILSACSNSPLLLAPLSCMCSFTLSFHPATGLPLLLGPSISLAYSSFTNTYWPCTQPSVLTLDSVVVWAWSKVLPLRVYWDGPDDGPVALEDVAQHRRERPQVLRLRQHWYQVLKNNNKPWGH